MKTLRVTCAVLSLWTGIASAVLIGPGTDIPTNANDNPWTQGTLAISLDPQSFAAGTYQIPTWNVLVNNFNASGTIIPMLLQLVSPGTYETLWVGAAFNPGSNEAFSVPVTGGSFTLTATTDVYAGYFTNAVGRNMMPMGNENGVGFTDLKDVPEGTGPTGAGQTVDAINHANLPRAYAFDIEVVPVPEPAVGALLILGSAAGMLVVRRRKPQNR